MSEQLTSDLVSAFDDDMDMADAAELYDECSAASKPSETHLRPDGHRMPGYLHLLPLIVMVESETHVDWHEADRALLEANDVCEANETVVEDPEDLGKKLDETNSDHWQKTLPRVKFSCVHDNVMRSCIRQCAGLRSPLRCAIPL